MKGNSRRNMLLIALLPIARKYATSHESVVQFLILLGLLISHIYKIIKRLQQESSQSSITHQNYAADLKEQYSSIFISDRENNQQPTKSIFKPLQINKEATIINLEFEFMGVRLYVRIQKEDINQESFADLVHQIEEIKGSRLTENGKEKLLSVLSWRLKDLRDDIKSQLSTRRTQCQARDMFIPQKINRIVRNQNLRKEKMPVKSTIIKKSGAQYASMVAGNKNR